MSGATKYQELGVAVKNEEKRLSNLRKRQQYDKPLHPPRPKPASQESTKSTSDHDRPYFSNKPSQDVRKCFRCNKPGHLMHDCRMKHSESTGTSRPGNEASDIRI